MKSRRPSQQAIEQGIKRRQERFIPTRERAVLEVLQEKAPDRKELTPEERAALAEPLERFWRMRLSQAATQEAEKSPAGSFTLPQAAENLGVSEKTVQRLIHADKILAEKHVCNGRKRLVIGAWALKRYKKLEKLDRYMRSTVSLPEQPEGLQPLFVFAPSLRGILKPELSVSLEELWRFARKPTREDIEEIRSRIPGHPQHFAVRFNLNAEEVYKTLEGIVRRIRPPTHATREPADVLRTEATAHLMMKVIPHLLHVEKNWGAYFQQSVKNFYRDRIRQAQKQPLARGDLAELPDDILE